MNARVITLPRRPDLSDTEPAKGQSDSPRRSLRFIVLTTPLTIGSQHCDRVLPAPRFQLVVDESLNLLIPLHLLSIDRIDLSLLGYGNDFQINDVMPTVGAIYVTHVTDTISHFGHWRIGIDRHSR